MVAVLWPVLTFKRPLTLFQRAAKVLCEMLIDTESFTVGVGDAYLQARAGGVTTRHLEENLVVPSWAEERG